MIDNAKRHTLKSITAAGIGSAALSAGGLAYAASELAAADTLLESLKPNSSADQLTFKVSHSWAANDVKLVLKNQSPTPTTITQMMPGQLSTSLGQVDFDAVMETGPLRLAPGQEVSIHLQRDGAVAGLAQLRELQSNIAENISVVTDQQTFAVVAPAFDPQIV